MTAGAVTATEFSQNAKLSSPRGIGMSATYATQETCPQDCPLLGAGCYAERGFVRWTTGRTNRAARRARGRLRPVDFARLEAEAIRALTGWRKLRVHVVGDCRTPAAAGIIGRAMLAHERKHGREAWTYTHAWHLISVDAWRGARVLASCQTAGEARRAQARGYPVALIVGRVHPSRQVYQVDGLDVIPCPAEFHTNGKRATTCEDCQVCARVDRLRASGRVVGFAEK